MGIPKDSPAGRRRFGEVREQRQKEELPEAEWKAIERGWRRGEEGFRAELLAQVRELRAEHYGEEVRQAEEERALAIVKKEPEARGWKEKRRIERREGDPEKLKIAVHSRRETTMTL